MPLCHGPIGRYYEVDIDIVLLFGLTELKAQIAWTEDVRHILYYSFRSMVTELRHREKRKGLNHFTRVSNTGVLITHLRGPAEIIYDTDI